MAVETRFEAGDLVYVRALTSQHCALGLVEWVAGRWARIVLVTDTYPWDGGVSTPAGTSWTIPTWQLEAIRS